MISKNTIDCVFETARVEEVISDFINLKRSGSGYKGLSPFVDEKTPSFMVSPSKGIWKDFSSGKGGNVVSFLMEHEHYSYPEAICYLAQKYGIEVEETDQTDEQKKEQDDRESMYLVSKYSQEYFHKMMLNEELGKAIGLRYFKERGFTDSIIETFQLGYCLDDWSSFTEEALRRGYDLKYLESTGLTVVMEDEKRFDRFKGRVIFPIHSMSGRVLGFGARTLSDDKKFAKYLNSPESLIYQKSKILYGIYQAKACIIKEDSCYLVEGYTDVISMHQKGVYNTVASSGTALTKEQILLIKRFTKNITILFDGDEAGKDAVIRGIDLILEQGMNIKIISLAQGEDPDSFSKKKSEEELKSYLDENGIDFIEFKSSFLKEGSKSDPLKKGQLIRDIVSSISKIPNRIYQELYIRQCARMMEISEEVLFNELAQCSNKKNRKNISHGMTIESDRKVSQDTKVPDKFNSLELYEREIIKILLLYGNEEVDFVDWIQKHNSEGKIIMEKQEYKDFVSREIYLQLQEDEIIFSNALFQQVYKEVIDQIHQEGVIVLDDFVTHSDLEIANQVTHILMEEDRYVLNDWTSKNIEVPKKKEMLQKTVQDAILNLRRILIDLKVSQLLDEISFEKRRTEILQEVINYTQLKVLLFEKLNRVL